MNSAFVGCQEFFLTNQFQNSFECLSGCDWIFCAQSEASIYRTAFDVIFLYEGVYLQTRLLAVHVWLVQESLIL